MKPLIFEFREDPSEEIPDYSSLEYDDRLNLTIDKISKKPAIESIDMETETFTKTHGEGSDSDRDISSLLVDTETGTYTQTETSDSDKDTGVIRQLLDTNTFTRTQETSDTDKPTNVTNYYSQN